MVLSSPAALSFSSILTVFSVFSLVNCIVSTSEQSWSSSTVTTFYATVLCTFNTWSKCIFLSLLQRLSALIHDGIIGVTLVAVSCLIFLKKLPFWQRFMSSSSPFITPSNHFPLSSFTIYSPYSLTHVSVLLAPPSIFLLFYHLKKAIYFVSMISVVSCIMHMIFFFHLSHRCCLLQYWFLPFIQTPLCISLSVPSVLC